MLKNVLIFKILPDHFKALAHWILFIFLPILIVSSLSTVEVNAEVNDTTAEAFSKLSTAILANLKNSCEVRLSSSDMPNELIKTIEAYRIQMDELGPLTEIEIKKLANEHRGVLYAFYPALLPDKFSFKAHISECFSLYIDWKDNRVSSTRSRKKDSKKREADQNRFKNFRTCSGDRVELYGKSFSETLSCYLK